MSTKLLLNGYVFAHSGKSKWQNNLSVAKNKCDCSLQLCILKGYVVLEAGVFVDAGCS